MPIFKQIHEFSHTNVLNGLKAFPWFYFNGKGLKTVKHAVKALEIAYFIGLTSI
jgi:hypothetical protein